MVRIASADGRAILGRVVDAGDLGAICEDLGIDAPKLTPQAIVAAAKGGARVPVNGLDALMLKTSRVAGSPRHELVGAPAERLSWYKQHGCYTEIIAYKTRLFVPEERAEAMLTMVAMTAGQLAEAA